MVKYLIFQIALFILLTMVESTDLTNTTECPQLNCSNSTEYDINIEYMFICGDRCGISDSFIDKIIHIYYIIAGGISVIFFTLIGIISVVKKHMARMAALSKETIESPNITKSIEDKLADIASPISQSPSSYKIPPAPIINI